MWNLARHDDGRQALYGIIQGGVHTDLRRISASTRKIGPFSEQLWWMPSAAVMRKCAAVVEGSLPYAHPMRPVHFLGIGRMKDVFTFVRLGADTFDCVIPTRLARHGTAFLKGTPGETINLNNARYRQ
ncbi:MAG: tRNA-guanine transglycosylase [Alphaproteobacteria bacterium]